MVDFIYNVPSFLLFIVISFIAIGISFFAIKLVHRHVPSKFRYEDNQAIICTSALIGIIYAILIGFTILYELNNFNKADDAESAEAKAVFSIFRVARVLPEPSATKVRGLAVDYIKNVIYHEWPLMEKGKLVDKIGIQMIENISRELRSFTNIRAYDAITLEALNTLALNTNNLFDIHEERVSKVHTALTTNIWFVLLLGTFLTIAINFILGMEFRFHFICVASIALMVSAVLYLVITLNHPYRGDFSIQPSTFIATLDYIQLKV